MEDGEFDDDLTEDISSQGNYDGYGDDDLSGPDDLGPDNLGPDDLDGDDFVTDSTNTDDRPAKRGRRPRRSSGRSRDQIVDADANEDTTNVRFPTWEEAISVLVESNIKNHSRSPNRGGGGGRGRNSGSSRGRSR